MSDVPYFEVRSVEKNVLESPSATTSCDFLLKETPPFWLQRLWQAHRKLLLRALEDFRHWIKVDPLQISGFSTFIHLLIHFTLYLLKLLFQKNSQIRLIVTAENLVPKRAYFLEDLHLSESWTPSTHTGTAVEEKVITTISGHMKDSPLHHWTRSCHSRSLPFALQSTLHPVNGIR